MNLAFPSEDELRPLIELARREDLGPTGDDVTSRLTIAANATGTATLVQKQPGVACGLPIVEMICRAYDGRLRVTPAIGASIESLEGRYSTASVTPLLQIHGPTRSLLSAERVILNFLQRMSGVATLTHQFVEQVAGTSARIYDTRKTLPGFRSLDKYAVRAAGGCNHRIGLYDGLLIKDNHVAAISVDRLVEKLQPVVNQCRSEDAERLVEIEVDRLDQLAEVLKIAGVRVILLDNMACPTMRNAVELRDHAGKQGVIALEASGGVTLQIVNAIARTGVDRIAIGAITHSAGALDIGLDVAG